MKYPREFSRLYNLQPWYCNSLLYGLISSGENSAHFLQLMPRTIFQFFIPPGTHYCWVSRGSMQCSKYLLARWPTASNFSVGPVTLKTCWSGGLVTFFKHFFPVITHTADFPQVYGLLVLTGTFDPKQQQPNLFSTKKNYTADKISDMAP